MTALVGLKKRREFLHAAKGRRSHAPSMVVQAARRPADGADGPDLTGIGFTASRKVGSAVVRNRAKRRLRALVRELLPGDFAVAGMDLVVVLRKEAATAPFGQLRQELTTALRRLEGRKA